MRLKTDSEIKKEKRFIEMTDDLVKFVENMTGYLSACGDDLTLLTLKGHLVAESLLETILVRVLDITELPKEKDSRLGFYQKLKLVQAVACIREPGPNADLFCAIAELNRVRNQLAHNLKNQAAIETDIKSLIAIYHKKAGGKPDWNKTLPTLLRTCLCQLCAFLFQVRKHFYDLEETVQK